MKTAGIDLATDPKKTGVCVIDWSTHSPHVSFVVDKNRHDDDQLVELCHRADIDKVGIDCPFGWPEPFLRAIAAHDAHGPRPGRNQPADEFRQSLKFRQTDFHVHEQTGSFPLPVAADRIGATAIVGVRGGSGGLLQ